MADVRALLKAKRQEARIVHPLASYSQSSQLRCVACGTVVKHASAWEGHLGSKAHRTNVARLKEEERLREEQQRKQVQMEAKQEERTETVRDKRKLVDPSEGNVIKKPRVESISKGFPEDFFSDPSKAPAISQSDSEDEDEPMRSELLAKPANEPTTALDDEWERFQREVVNRPAEETDKHEVYEQATVAVEAVMVDTTQGIPTDIAKPSRVGDTTTEVVDEAELRRRKEQEEKELIMDRLLEEERAQEEADMKVVQMKNRLDALKKRRELRKIKT